MRNVYTVGLLLISMGLSAQVKLSNGLTYKTYEVPGKVAAPYTITDVGAQKKQSDTAVNRFIVKFKSDPEAKAKKRKLKSTVDRDHQNFAEDLRRIESNHRQRNLKSFRESKIHHHFRNAFNGKSITTSSAVANEIRKLPYVHYVVEDKKIKVSDETSNSIIEADKVWSQLNLTGKGVVIGIIDTGIDYTHPDISDGIGAGHKVLGGYDFVNGDNDPMDDHGHGTHVSGIAAANGPNLRGVAPEAKLMGFKVLTADGWGYNSWIIAGIERCLDPDQNPNTDDQVDVVNMSLGGPTDGPDPMSEAVNNAVAAGVVFAVAAGNNGVVGYGSIESPGIAANAITVGATDSNDMLAYFSSKGPSPGTHGLKPDLVAPGVDINSSLPGGNYASWSGTSMATPHVTGAVALLLQLHPDWTPEQIKAVLMQNSVPVYGGTFDVGAGRLDILNAANSTFSISPGSISLGALDRSQAIYSTTIPLTVSNYSGQTKTLSLTSSGDLNLPAITTTIDQPSFTLAGNSTKIVHVTISIQTANIAIRDLPALYLGAISISDNTTSYNVPVGFVNPQHLTIHFGQSLPGILAVVGTDNYFFRFVAPTSQTMNIDLPSGEFELIAQFGFNKIVAKENIFVPNDTDIFISESEAKNELVFRPVDENNKTIVVDYPMLAQGALQLKQPGGQTYSSIWLGPIDTLITSNLSDKWVVSFKLFDRINNSNKVYNIGAVGVGVSGSKVFTNSSSELVAVNYNYPHIKGSTVNLKGHLRSSLGFIWDLWNWGSDISGDFIEFHRKMDPRDPVITTQFEIDASSAGGYAFQTPGLTIYQNDSIAYHRTVYASLSETEKLTSSSLQVNLNQTVLQWAGEPANNNYEIALDPLRFDGYFVNNRGDKVLGKINYQLSTSAGIATQSGVYNPPIGWPFAGSKYEYLDLTNLTPDRYTLKVDFADHYVQGKYGSASVQLHFNTAQDDRNPPYLETFELYSNNKLTNLIQSGDDITVRLSIADYCFVQTFPCVGFETGVANYSLEYKALTDTSWIQVPISGTIANLPTNLISGFYSLRIKAVDNASNDVAYTLEPAFSIDPNPNPVPFERPGLIYPANRAKRVAQNTLFVWSPLKDAQSYDFELSTDSTFATTQTSLTLNNDSIRLNNLLDANAKYYWRVRAKITNTLYTPWSEPFSFKTGRGILSTIKLISPADGSKDLPGSINFTWTRATAATAYEWQLASLHWSVTLIDTTTSLWASPNSEYEWRVRPQYDSIDGEWTPTFHFKTGKPKVTLVSPKNGAINVAFDSDLTWSNTFIGERYRLRVSLSQDMSNPVIDSIAWANTGFKLYNTNFSRTYYWKVDAIYQDPQLNTSSEVWSFQIEPRPDNTIIRLVTPFDGAVNLPGTINLAWTRQPKAIGYDLEYFVEDGRIVWHYPIQDTTATISVVPGSKLKWHVRPLFETGSGFWTDPFSFSTGQPVITLFSPSNNSTNVPFDAGFYWGDTFWGQYQLIISTSADLTNPLFDQIVPGPYFRMSGLQFDTVYYWKIVGEYWDGSRAESPIWSFTTQSKLEDTVIKLISPVNGSGEIPNFATFVWTRQPNAISYNLEYEIKDANAKWDLNTADTTLTMSMFPDQTATWKVQPVYQNGFGSWTDPFAFKTAKPKLTGTNPVGNSIDVPINTDLSWTDSFEVSAGTYQLQVSTSPDFSTPVIDQTLVSYQLNYAATNLNYGTQYYWQVIADYAFGVRAKSDIYQFKTQFAQPSIYLVLPADKGIDQPLNSYFKWKGVSFETTYKLMLSQSSDFSDANSTFTSDTLLIISNLKPATEYFWKVGLTYLGVDYWSPAYSFQTITVLAVEENKETKIYPNPASSIVTFEFQSNDHDLLIINSLGQHVWTHKGSGGTAVWNLAGIESGVYFARIKDGEKTSNTKIVVCR